VGVLALAATGCTPVSGKAAASPTSLGFPETALGVSSTATVTISNVASSGALTIEGTVVTGAARGDFRDDFDDSGAVVLQPGAAHVVTVTFTPSAPGARAAALVVSQSGPDPLTVPLTGNGVVAPPGANPLSGSPLAIDFGPVPVGDQRQSPVTLTNGGTGPITVDGATLAGPGAGMFAGASTASPGQVVAPGASLVLPVTFAPSVAGSYQAALVVSHSGTNPPVVVPLSGTGTAPGPGTVLYRINAGGPALDGSPGWEADTREAPNPDGNGAAAGNATTLWTQPVDLSDPSVPAGTPPALFASERSDGPAAPDLTYRLPIPAGVAVEVRLYLAEMNEPYFAPGARAFDVVVDGRLVHDDVDVFAEVGARKALVLRVPVVSDGVVDVTLVPAVRESSVKGIELVTAGATPSLLEARPSAFEVGHVPARQRARATFELSNLQTDAPLTITSAAVFGPDAAMFAVHVGSGLPVTLAPGGSVPVTADFLPTTVGPHEVSLLVGYTGAGSGSLTVPVRGTGDPPPVTPGPGFTPARLEGVTFSGATSLQFGPDGRLYVSELNGTIRALTVARTPTGHYTVTAAETITRIASIPNHDDTGAPNPSVTGRLVTGILVTGTPAQPVIYAVSSDPRFGAGPVGGDSGLDTNSGILTRLTRTPTGWVAKDLVRGLPRSEENHTGNGLAIVPGTSTLLVAYGGNTNAGAPAHNFAFLPEYALSGAIVSIDLGAIGETTYTLPTLDDEDRPGTADAGDPWGGNNGKNQARLVPGGPVQVYAPGFRNPYDLVFTHDGRLYTIDNGANAGWGDAPRPDDASGTCTNDPVELGHSDGDALLLVPGPGFYGGHPNPVRANRANTFDASNPQSPVAVANPVECDYRAEVEAGAMTTFAFSTNGIDEYTAETFGGAMHGDLVTVSLDGSLHRIELSPDGTAVTARSLLASGFGPFPLDVIAEGDAEPFPGTIWVADNTDGIHVFEPHEAPCTGADDPALDEDGDGFDNADEIDNGTDPCSAAVHPPDADGDLWSDRNDPDDDGDGRADTTDLFARDPADGRTHPLPVVLTWTTGSPQLGGLLGLGFGGLMSDGVTDYLARFDPQAMTAGGAAGVLTVDAVGEGDALGPGGSQDNGFQVGLDVGPATAPFVVHTRLPAPFAGTSPTGGASYGVYFGDGTQDGYVKLVVAANDGAGGFQVVREVGGVPAVVTAPGPAWPGPGVVDLFLRVDPAALSVTASATVDGGPPIAVGGPQPVPAAWFGGPGTPGPAAGLISTSAGPMPPYPATWAFLEAVPAT
jgi:hypothetical protein